MKKTFYEYTADFLFDIDYFNNRLAIKKRIDKILSLSTKSQQLGKENCYHVNISIFKDINKPIYLEYLKDFYILKKNFSTLQHVLKKFDDDFDTTSQIYFA